MSKRVLNVIPDDRPDRILVYERGDDGETHERYARAEYTSWHRAAEIDRNLMRQLNGSRIVQSVKPDGSWIRIAWLNRETRWAGIRELREFGVDSYEADVDPCLTYLIESKAEIAQPRRCYLDIEADSRVPLNRKEDMRVLSVAIVGEKDDDEHIVVLEEDTDEAEAALLERVCEILEGYDQICVWEGDFKGGEFDSVVLPARLRLHSIPVDDRRWMWLNQLAVWKKMNQHAAESGAEKESFRLDDIAFEQIGEEKTRAPAWVVERIPKAERGLGPVAWDLWAEGGKFRKLLAKYNLHDSRLLRSLERAKGFIGLFQSVCEACGIPPVNRSLGAARRMDGFMLRLGREHDHRFPTKHYENDDEDEVAKFKGAVVFPPKSVPDEDSGWTADDARRWREAHGFLNGILYNVHVCDFSSLYPSMMQTFNLSAEAVVGWREKGKPRPEGTIESPGTGLLTRAEPHGFLKLAFFVLKAKRKEYSDLAATLPVGSPEWLAAMSKSSAYKTINNSFYGVGGSKHSRFNHRDCSEACTQNSVHFLKIVVNEGERRGMVTVAGDTDSSFVIQPSTEGFQKFVRWLNAKRFPSEVKSYGCVDNFIEIAFEKTFERIVFLKKKNYIGRYSQYKGMPADRECHGFRRTFKKKLGDFVWLDGEKTVANGEECPTCKGPGKLAGEPEVKGVAYKRGDRGKLARELQGRVIDLLVGGLRVRDAKTGKKVSPNADVFDCKRCGKVVFGKPEDPKVPECGHEAVALEVPAEDISIYHAVISRMRDRVLAGDLSVEEVRLSKTVREPLRDYGRDGNTVPTHILVARELVARGQVIGVGSKIDYVVVDGKSPQRVIPAEDYEGVCDRFYLWESVFSPTELLLESAFPQQDWKSWGKVRPKPGKKGKKPLPGQLGLAIDVSTPEEAQRDIGVSSYKAKPVTLRVPDSKGDIVLQRVRAAVMSHPGARAVQFVLVTASGSEAVVPTDLRVSPSPRFQQAYEEAIADPPIAAS